MADEDVIGEDFAAGIHINCSCDCLELVALDFRQAILGLVLASLKEIKVMLGNLCVN